MSLFRTHSGLSLRMVYSLILFAFWGSCLSQTALATAETDLPDLDTSERSSTGLKTGLNIATELGIAYAKQGKLAEVGMFFKNPERTFFQLDALYVDVKGRTFDGLGGHYYFHETENTVYGLSVAYVSGDLVKSEMLALEGIYFPKRFKHLNFGSKIGYASIEYNRAMPFVDTDLKKAFGMVFCEYFRDRWVLNLAYENRFSLNTIRLKAEYFSSIEDISFFCELQESSNDYDHAIIGLRTYFGNKGTTSRLENSESTRSMRKSRGHFSNSVKETLLGIGVYGALYNKNGKRYARENGLKSAFNNYGLVMEQRPFDPSDLKIIEKIIDDSNNGVIDADIIKQEIIKPVGISEAGGGKGAGSSFVIYNP